MSCSCGTQIFNETMNGGTLAGTGITETVHPNRYFQIGSGGTLASGSALVNSNLVWDGYAGVFHLIEQGNGTPGEYKNSTGSAGATAFQYAPRQNPSTLWDKDQLYGGTEVIQAPMDTMPDDGDYSVSFWMKPTGQFNDRTIFSRGIQNNNEAEGVSISIGYTLANLVFARVQVVGSTDWKTYTLSGQTVLTLGCWYYVALVFASGQSITIYLDGFEEVTTAITETTLVPSTSFVQFGRYNSQENFAGELQEVRYLPKALTAEWIATEALNFCNGFVTIT